MAEVSAETFVVTWELSANVFHVAVKLELPLRSVVGRAREYRRRGAKLKRMPSIGELLLGLYEELFQDPGE